MMYRKENTTMKKTLFGILAVLILASLIVGSIGCSSAEDLTKLASSEGRLRVGTTTSLYDTGLWTYLEPKFEKEYDVQMDILPVASGQAITYGKNGDVDVITVHDKPAELLFIADNYAVERVPFAYNYFIIVGPENDPAQVQGLSPEAAFKKIAETGSKFVSRGQSSGTYSKEQAIWKAAGYTDYNAFKTAGISAGWYKLKGGGMGETLTMANELQAYTLTDEGTYLAYKSDLDLVPLVENGSIMLNVYSVIVCTLKGKNPEMAQNLVAFLTSEEIQKLIDNYGKSTYGKSLFIACAGNEPTS
jgi:tungstate transport system substrate-binding protein